MIEVTLYTKDGCHLCEEVAAKLTDLQERYPHHLTEVDITEDDDLFRRYRYAIPVVHVGDVELRAPVTEEELAGALHTAGQGDA
ncbi:MAG: glutaredoxin family protein [Candidatus Promineifilaceae bacterium]|nr:glutaredoxin family protein [Candidatus Promineifilaceae bacterium]